jgi:hypothetical protein
MKNSPAVRAYQRIMRPITEAMDMAAAMDAEFDGGEWSSSAHDRLFEDEEARVIDLVTNRFGIERHELMNALYAHTNREYSEWCERSGRWAAPLLD